MKIFFVINTASTIYIVTKSFVEKINSGLVFFTFISISNTKEAMTVLDGSRI